MPGQSIWLHALSSRPYWCVSLFTRRLDQHPVLPYLLLDASFTHFSYSETYLDHSFPPKWLISIHIMLFIREHWLIFLVKSRPVESDSLVHNILFPLCYTFFFFTFCHVIRHGHRPHADVCYMSLVHIQMVTRGLCFVYKWNSYIPNCTFSSPAR